MAENRMLILSSELVDKIDQNRGDLSHEKFINLLLASRLEQKSDEERYVTKEAVVGFQQDIRDLLRTFLEFFVSYGLELGRDSDKMDMESLSKKLQGLGVPVESGSGAPTSRAGK